MLATRIRQSETPSDKITGGRHEGVEEGGGRRREGARSFGNCEKKSDKQEVR